MKLLCFLFGICIGVGPGVVGTRLENDHICSAGPYRWSEGSLVRRIVGPKGRWSEGSLVRKVVVISLYDVSLIFEFINRSKRTLV